MTLVYFILVLGVTILVHEFGHFIFAKRAGVYVYEFSLGMGPRIFKFKRKNDETIYSVRLFPIGGFVSMAGENIDTDDNVPLEDHMFKKSWLNRFLIIVAGVAFNFIFAIILLFVIGLVNGNNINKPYISEIDSNYKIASTDVEVGDLILSVNGKKVNYTDILLLEMQVNYGESIILELEGDNGNIKEVKLDPTLVKEDDVDSYKYGFSLESTTKKGFLEAVKYAFLKTGILFHQMVLTIWYLITGVLKLSSLSGPIGIYNVVGESARAGLINLVYLIAFLCVNVGFINLLPIPAFDGGRLLFLIIEKIKGSPINQKVEGIIHSIGFVLLMILMIVVSFNDIIKLF